MTDCLFCKFLAYRRIPFRQPDDLRCFDLKIKRNLAPFAVVVHLIQVDSGGDFLFVFDLGFTFQANHVKHPGFCQQTSQKSLVGTVKETIMQVSRSKKWESKVALDEQGNPLLTAKGKKVLRTSYSVLQDDFFNYMKAAGYTDVERGERGSTEEHLTVTQFKVAQEQQRLEDVTAQIAQTEQALDTAQAAVEKKHKELQSLQKQTKEQRTAALTVQEIRSMGKKTITGNITLTPSECSTLKDYAVNGILAKAENSRLEEKLQQAQKSAAVWKQRYESLKELARPYLEAVKLAPERCGLFLMPF